MINIQKKILITWWNGFIGSNLVHKLVLLWAKNLHLILRENANISRIESIKASFQAHYISLTDKENLKKTILSIRPDIVYHIAAAGTSVWKDSFSFEELYQFNFFGTMNLIDACKEVWVEYFINTWTSSEYGEKEAPMKEDDILEPNNDYGISKAAWSLYAQYMGKKKNFPIFHFRLFAVYGTWEETRRLIPTLIDAYKKKENPKLGSPNSVRDYILVDDVVDIYLSLDKLDSKSWWEIYNLWTGVQHKTSEVIALLNDITGLSITPLYGSIKNKQTEPNSWLADIGKLQKIFWYNPTSLREWLTKLLNN